MQQLLLLLILLRLVEAEGDKEANYFIKDRNNPSDLEPIIYNQPATLMRGRARRAIHPVHNCNNFNIR